MLVERVRPVLGARTSSFHRYCCHASRNPLCFIDSGKSSCSCNLSSKNIHVKGICLLTNKTSREKSSACGGRESRINRFTIPSTENRGFGKCDLATTFGTTKLETYPTPATFKYWKLNFKTEVCSVSYHPSDAMSWIREIEAAQDISDLRTSLDYRETLSQL